MGGQLTYIVSVHDSEQHTRLPCRRLEHLDSKTCLFPFFKSQDTGTVTVPDNYTKHSDNNNYTATDALILHYRSRVDRKSQRCTIFHRRDSNLWLLMFGRCYRSKWCLCHQCSTLPAHGLPRTETQSMYERSVTITGSIEDPSPHKDLMLL